MEVLLGSMCVCVCLGQGCSSPKVSTPICTTSEVLCTGVHLINSTIRSTVSLVFLTCTAPFASCDFSSGLLQPKTHTQSHVRAIWVAQLHGGSWFEYLWHHWHMTWVHTSQRKTHVFMTWIWVTWLEFPSLATPQLFMPQWLFWYMLKNSATVPKSECKQCVTSKSYQGFYGISKPKFGGRLGKQSNEC